MNETDDRLSLLVERIERLLEERSGITQDIRDVYAEAKAVGYDTTTLRKLVARRAQAPADRAEADQLLEVYEAAIGMADGEGLPSIEDLKPDAAAIALALLTEEVAALDEPDQAAALVGHVMHLIDLRLEIAELRRQESERKKLAKLEGFEPQQIAVTVRWFEKCAKHGAEAMKAGEATFRLYRSTVDRHQRLSQPVTTDPKLQQLVTPKKTSAAPKGASAAMIWANMGREG